MRIGAFSSNVGASAHNGFENFDSDTMNITIYIEQFETFYNMWEIPDDCKVKLFICP